VQDVTEARQAEDQIRFQAHLPGIQAAVIATDLQGTVTHWNRYARATVRLVERGGTGRDVAELTVSPETPRWREDHGSRVSRRVQKSS